MKIQPLTGLALVGLCVGSVSGAPATDAQVEAELRGLAREISATLPSGSQQSMVVAVNAGPGRRFTYVSVQSVPAREWTASMKEHSSRIARNDYCTNPSLKAFRHYSVTVTWQISDLEGRHIASNVVSPTDCR